jgi:hypothetical protein
MIRFDWWRSKPTTFDSNPSGQPARLHSTKIELA